MAESKKTYKNVFVESQMDHEYKEMFMGKEMVFKPKEQKKMNRYEAAMFLGQNPGTNVDTGNMITKAFKTIPILDEEPEKITYISQLDGKEFSSREDLDKHLDYLRKKAFPR